jgi:hypothetical protein
MERSNRLEGWKEIATYLGITEKTARRWELKEGLPVYRHQHEERGSVFSFTTELEQWRLQRAGLNNPTPAEEKPKKRHWALVGAILLVVTLGAAWQWNNIAFQLRGPVAFGPVTSLTTAPGVEWEGVISADGQWLAYTTPRGERTSLWLRDLSSGQDLEIPITAEHALGPCWSRRKPVLYFLAIQGDTAYLGRYEVSSRELGTVARLKRPREISTHLSRRIDISPEEDFLFLGNIEGLQAVRLAGGEVRQLAAQFEYPAISDSGRLMAMRQVGYNKLQLCEINGWRQAAASGAAAAPHCLDWVNPAVNGVVWLPNSRLLASMGGIGYPRFVELDLRARRERPIQLADRSVMTPSLNSQGRLVYSELRYDLGVYRLPVTEADPQRAVLLTDSTAHELGGLLSADGQWLGFSSDRDRSTWDHYLLELATGKILRLTRESYETADTVCISGDGRWMIGSGSKANQRQIYLMDRISATLRKLSPYGRMKRCAIGPDAAYVSGATTRPGLWKIHLADGKEELLLAGEFGPVWLRRGGRELLTVKDGFGWSVDLATRQLRQLGPAPGQELVVVGEAGTWAYERSSGDNRILHHGWDGQLKRQVKFGTRRLANFSLSGDERDLIIAVTSQPHADIKTATLLP